MLMPRTKNFKRLLDHSSKLMRRAVKEKTIATEDEYKAPVNRIRATWRGDEDAIYRGRWPSDRPI